MGGEYTAHCEGILEVVRVYRRSRSMVLSRRGGGGGELGGVRGRPTPPPPASLLSQVCAIP